MPPRRFAATPWVLAVTLTAAGCGSDAAMMTAGEVGGPLPGLSDAESARFLAGQALFNRVFTPEHGLGPLFNENQCSACHTDPASGGTGEQRVTKATRWNGATCDLLADRSGRNVRTQATAAMRAHGLERESVPQAATEVGRFTVPFLFGLGLLEAIPEAEILSRADPDDRDGDGVSGRVGRTADGRLGRFGRKADFATIEDFTVGALLLEMGLTSPQEPHEAPAGGRPIPPEADPVPEPEVDAAAVDALVDFVRFLSPLAPRRPISAGAADSLRRGERWFTGIGCASCHVPVLITGRNPVRALDRKPVELYSDLLLHDMGPRLANVCAPGVSPSELRTAPLMGLSARRRRFMHDGRAPGLREAILLHGGEAQAARDRFAQLDLLRQLEIV
ncbi:MAG TPA: di-heme oxidoredictase family protein, partial [Gemmatimonadales bacterium]|nr:di-heme oxidoredictase family protein [Gemmatimonadales bacterium]